VLGVVIAVLSGLCAWSALRKVKTQLGIVTIMKRWVDITLRGKEALHEHA
jgi:hypothetical protein